MKVKRSFQFWGSFKVNVVGFELKLWEKFTEWKFVNDDESILFGAVFLGQCLKFAESGKKIRTESDL